MVNNGFLAKLIVALSVIVALAGALTLKSSSVSGFMGSSSNFSHANKADSAASLAPELATGTWINSQPLTLQSLRGRVVLIEFWTFACYNCRNTLPFVKSWDKRYGDKGLTVIGVHSPELEEERDIANVRREVASLEIRYPVVTDNDYSTWRAYSVNAWPTLFLLDKTGRIRWSHVGEGAYDDAEKMIQNLLSEDVKKKSSNPENAGMADKIEKTEEEWRRELTPDQYKVLRQSGTERAFTGAYWDNHEHGTYYCAACGAKLFSSDTKFESGSGWPSFYAPTSTSSVDLKEDDSLGMGRTEVRCHRCGSHLGHVFDDGPAPTGLRYCMNSIAMKFEKE